uniref:CCHC-type domain-containing protein n=1 Tax=Strongyloides papillosus TaxID=174720 RepID=A0A0N5BI78_STREA
MWVTPLNKFLLLFFTKPYYWRVSQQEEFVKCCTETGNQGSCRSCARGAADNYWIRGSWRRSFGRITPFASLSEKKRVAVVKDTLVEKLGLGKPVIGESFSDDKEKLVDVEVVLKNEETASVIVKVIEEMPDYIGKVKMFEDVSEDIGPWLNRLGRAMTLQKTVEEEKVLVLMTLVCDEIVMCIQKEMEKKAESTYKDICDFLKDRYDGQLARSTIKSKLKNFKVDPMAPEFEEQLKELAELVRKSQPNASEEAIIEAQCNRIEREVEDWEMLWNKATSQEWRSSSELISALVSTNDHFKRKKKRGLQRKKVTGIHNRHENHLGKQYDEKSKVKNVLSCFGCGEQGHKRYECLKKGKIESFIQSKLCEVKEVKEESKIKADFVNRSEVKGLGEDITLTVLVKCTKNSERGYKSTLALIDRGTNKTSVTYNLAEAMGWKVDELDEVKVELAGNVGGTLKKDHQIKLMPIQGGFDVDLWVCVETTRRRDERYGITLGTDFLDMKGVTVHHGQNKMTIGDKLYHGELLISTHPTVFGGDNEPCVIEVPKFQFSEREVPKHPLFSVKSEMREAVQEQIESWKRQGIVAPCLWPHSVLNLIAVPKPSPVNKHGIRLCLDARPINQITCRFEYPIPAIDDILQKHKGHKWYTVIDCAQYFLQLKIRDEDMPYLSFKDMKGRVMMFQRLPFGTKNASSYAQRVTDFLIENTCASGYIDDLLISTNSTLEHHAMEVAKLLSNMEAMRIKANHEKFKFAEKEVLVLAHHVDEMGSRTNEDAIKAWREYETPRSWKAVRRFTGGVTYFKSHIPGLSIHLKDLHAVENRREKFVWTKELDESFMKAKEAVCKAMRTYRIDDSKPLMLFTDASQEKVAAALVQKTGNEEDSYVPIAFFSKILPKRIKPLPAIVIETRAIQQAILHLSKVIGGREVIIYSDHKPLTTCKKPSENLKVEMLMQEMARRGMRILYRKGSKNELADSLSRATCKSLKVSEEDRIVQTLKLWRTLYDKENDESDSIEETIDVVDEGVVSEKIKEVPKEIKKVFQRFHDQLGHPSYERSFIMVD